jgi:hypothetical protein
MTNARLIRIQRRNIMTNARLIRNVAFWHKGDMPRCLLFGRFGG